MRQQDRTDVPDQGKCYASLMAGLPASTPSAAPVAGSRRTGGLAAWLLLALVPLLPLQNIIDKINTPLRSIKGLNFLNLTALLLIGLWFWRTIVRGRPLLPRSRYNRVLGAYFVLTYLALWRAVAYIDAPLPLGPSDPSFIFWKDYMICFLMFFVVSTTIDEEQTMRRLTMAMLAVLPYMVYVHNNNLQWANSWHFDDDMRVRGTMMHLGSNELAAFYVIGLMVSVGLAMSMKELKLRLYWLFSALLLGWGVIYSYSRSAYIASLAGLALVGLLRNLRIAILFVAFIMVAPLVLPASVMDRFDMINGKQAKTDESTERRMILWDVAWKRFQENPILGTGYRSFTKLNRFHMDTHNMYLKVLCELGIFGFLLYVAQLLVGIRQGWLLARYQPTPFAKGLGTGLLGASLAAIVLNLFGDRSSYLAVTAYFWVWQGMGARILRGVELEGGWSR
ncbi:MAG: O-antigen ligase family protein [Deltaproteobacteria bacterium]|nr:O-antigen ligase family protein [Deltaproteobacteria bacterium]